MRRAFAILAASLVASATVHAAAAAPGAIFAQTARVGVTVTSTAKDAQPLALVVGETFSASGQVLNAPENLATTLILSNGDAVCLPVGGRVTLEEFTQEPIPATVTDRDYEPSRSTLRLNLAQGTLLVSSRKPDSTSTLSIATPLARFDCHSQSFAVRADGNSVTLTLFDGTVDVTVAETGFHDTLQAGQTAVLSRQNLHAAYPLKITNTTTAESDKLGVWLAVARTTERRITFTADDDKLQPHQQILQEFTQQMSVDDPRYR